MVARATLVLAAAAALAPVAYGLAAERIDIGRPAQPTTLGLSAWRPFAQPTRVLRLKGGADLASVVSTWSAVDRLIAGYLALSAPVLFVGMVLNAHAVGPWSKFAVGYAFQTPCSARTGTHSQQLALSSLYAVNVTAY